MNPIAYVKIKSIPGVYDEEVKDPSQQYLIGLEYQIEEINSSGIFLKGCNWAFGEEDLEFCDFPAQRYKVEIIALLQAFSTLGGDKRKLTEKQQYYLDKARQISDNLKPAELHLAPTDAILSGLEERVEKLIELGE